jgi:hypothetical protein
MDIDPVAAVPLATPMLPPADPLTVLAVALVIVVLAKTPMEDAEPIDKGASTALAVLEM